jgi:hypothetical protein
MNINIFFIRFFRIVQIIKSMKLDYLGLQGGCLNHLKDLLWFFKQGKHYVYLSLDGQINKMDFPNLLESLFNRLEFRRYKRWFLNLILLFLWFIHLYFEWLKHYKEIDSRKKSLINHYKLRHQNFQNRYILQFNFSHLFVHIQDWKGYRSY